MRVVKFAVVVVVLVGGLFSAVAGAQQSAPAPQMAPGQQLTLDQVIDRIIAREAQVVASLKDFNPLVETYIQNMKPDQELGVVPASDKYFLGRAELGTNVGHRSLNDKSGTSKKMLGAFGNFFSLNLQYLPRGFVQMVFLDNAGLSRDNYKFDYVRREFLGDVRCLVFDVQPTPRSGKGRFVGRIWVEDQDYSIVRFNGAYAGSSNSQFYFHFDSWRVQSGPGLWLPSLVYSEENDMKYSYVKRVRFKSQTRLWGYNLGRLGQEQELSKVLVEAAVPVTDKTVSQQDASPLQAQRAWDRRAEDNVVERLERIGLVAPRGDVDKILETVVNNLEVTNNLDIQPEVRCRVMLTSTLESFTLGRTIILSRGLIDVLPDEASLAMMIAYELSHIVLGHRIDSSYAFNDRMLFPDHKTMQHFYFARDPHEVTAANTKAAELIANSPYKDQTASINAFLTVLQSRSSSLPGLISPQMGNRVTFSPSSVAATPGSERPGSAPSTASGSQPRVVIAALPLGGRVKVDPWSGQIEMLKTKPVGLVSEREKMPFEVTPFMPYLTRQSSKSPATPAAMNSEPQAKPQQ